MAISSRLECTVVMTLWRQEWTEIFVKASESSRNTPKSSPNHRNLLKFIEYAGSKATDWRILWSFLVGWSARFWWQSGCQNGEKSVWNYQNHSKFTEYVKSKATEWRIP